MPSVPDARFGVDENVGAVASGLSLPTARFGTDENVGLVVTPSVPTARFQVDEEVTTYLGSIEQYVYDNVGFGLTPAMDASQHVYENVGFPVFPVPEGQTYVYEDVYTATIGARFDDLGIVAPGDSPPLSPSWKKRTSSDSAPATDVATGVQHFFVRSASTTSATGDSADGIVTH